MKILQLKYSLVSGGAERFVVDLSNRLQEKGCEVYLCTIRDDSIGNNGFYKNEISSKVKYINLKLKKGVNFTNIYYIGLLIKKIKPDVVHCHQNLVNYIFPLTAIFTNVKFFHTTHNEAPKEVKNKLEYWLRRFFFSTGMVKAITISNETSLSFFNYYKIKKYTEIYNGRKLPLPSTQVKSVNKFFSVLRKKNETVFLHVGRCSPQKNQKMLISVFNRLLDEGNSITLLIVGDGFDNSLLGEALKTMANKKIIFLGQKHNIADYFLNADAFCLTSIHEGMPITLIEALACGCTPICTPVGGIVDVVKNNITGYISESTLENDFYKSVVTYLNQKQFIKKETLKKIYAEQLSIETCAEKHLQLYNQ